MKRIGFLSLSVLMAMQSSFVAVAYAQNTGVLVATNPPANGKMYVGGAGVYRQVEENITSLAGQALNAAQVTQKEDKEFVMAAVSDIHEAYAKYADLLISSDLLGLETKGVAGTPVTIEEFMTAVAKIKASRKKFESLLVKNAAINKDVLPSNYTVVVNTDGKQQTVPSSGQVKLDKVIAKYQEIMAGLDIYLEQNFSNIKVKVEGQILTANDYGSLLQPSFKKLPIIKPDEAVAATDEMKRLRENAMTMAQNERRAFADIVREEYNTFARIYGSDYKYVVRSGTGNTGVWGTIKGWIFGTDEDQTETGKGETVKVEGINVQTDIAARNASFKRLVDLLYMRSYMRLSLGQQICALQPKMVQTTNFGAFQAIEALKELRVDVACTKAELEQALQYARLILKYSGAQADKVFEGNFMKAGVLNKLGSATTFVLGNRPSAEALHMLIQLIYADIQEELMMATPGRGLTDLLSMYTARYQSSESQKEYYKAVKCSIDNTRENCEGVDAFGQSENMGDVQKAFDDLKAKIKLSRDFLNKANLINESLEASRAENATSKKTVERNKRL